MPLDFQKFKVCDQATSEVSDYILDLLNKHSDSKTLLLVSGGSSIKVSANIASRIDINTSNSVTLGLVDERYGPVGHDSSNWVGLTDSGVNPEMFFASTQVLDEGTTLENTAEQYADKLQILIDENNYKIALLGMGDDGHIAGMKPRSTLDFDAFMGEDIVVGYRHDDFDRITMAARSLMQMDEIIVFVCGQAKAEVVKKLQADVDQKINEFPAQILKQLSAKVTVFQGMEG